MTPVTIADSFGIDSAALAALCESRRPHVLAALPFLAAEIADATSMHVLLKLCDRYGGSIVCIPKTSKPDRVLAVLLGRENLARLMERFGDANLNVPSKRAIARVLMPFVAEAMHADGHSHLEIARRLGVVDRTVRRYLQQIREAARPHEAPPGRPGEARTGARGPGAPPPSQNLVNRKLNRLRSRAEAFSGATMTELGDRLKALMAEKGVSAEQMGRAAGIEAGTVQQILRGEIARPPDQRLRGFAKALGVSFESLLEMIPRELREANAALLEASAPRRFLIRVIRAGLSGNGNFYPADVLREAVPKFEGVRVFVKADAEHLAGGGKDFRNLIGRLSAPRFVEGQGRDSGEIQADFDVLESAGDIAARLREAVERGMTGLFGFSIDAVGTTEIARIGNRRVRKATRLVEVKSVDLIVEPGAGGQLVNFIESQKGRETMDYLTQDQITAALREAKLPDYARRRLADDFADAEVTEDELKEAIARERDYLAEASDSGHVTGLGDYARVELIEGRDQKVAKMLDAFFDPKNRSVRSIRECYVTITGDRNFTGLLRNCDQALLRESLISSSFPNVLGDSIARQVIADYNVATPYDVWRDLVTVVPVQDFRTQERTRFGGYGDLPIVNEGAPYTALTSPTDEKATYAIKKRGGTEDLTLEMIANDDVGAAQQIPRKLVSAAKRTVSRFALDFLKDNPTIYDGIAWFHASHNNLGAAALSAAAVSVARIAMKQQPEKNSNERLGIGPRFLWVPDELEESAFELFRRDTNLDETFVQSLSLAIRPVWYWTDTNDWAATAPTSEVPAIEMGFFQGQEEPEVFIQDNPSVGSMFSHDKTTYKIRHIYGATVLDFRGAYKSVVA